MLLRTDRIARVHDKPFQGCNKSFPISDQPSSLLPTNQSPFDNRRFGCNRCLSLRALLRDADDTSMPGRSTADLLLSDPSSAQVYRATQAHRPNANQPAML